MIIESLSPEILLQVKRLGGRPNAKQFDETGYSVRKDIPVPTAIKELFSIEWPGKETAHYSAGVNGDYFWAQEIYFHAYQYCDLDDFGFEDRGDKELVRFCHARNKFFIMIDLKDPNPSDPLVYHVSSRNYSPVLGNGILLSIFLRNLNLVSKETATPNE